MPVDAATIQTRIDAAEAALATGVLSVRHGDTSTTFRSESEIEKLIARLRKQLASLQGKTNTRVKYITQASKGF